MKRQRCRHCGHLESKHEHFVSVGVYRTGSCRVPLRRLASGTSVTVRCGCARFERAATDGRNANSLADERMREDGKCER